MTEDRKKKERRTSVGSSPLLLYGIVCVVLREALSNDFVSVDDVYSVRQVCVVGTKIYAQDIVDARMGLAWGIYLRVSDIGSRIEIGEIISDTCLVFVGIECAFGYNDVYISRGWESIVGADYPGYLCLSA